MALVLRLSVDLTYPMLSLVLFLGVCWCLRMCVCVCVCVCVCNAASVTHFQPSFQLTLFTLSISIPFISKSLLFIISFH